MNPRRFAVLASLSALFGLIGLAPARAAIVRFNVTLDAAQETPASTSTATGTAVVLYDTQSNTLDLSVALTNFANLISNSHIHEGAPGVAGAPVVPLGDETNYTRSGTSITGMRTGLTYGGTPATLLSGGAYLNFHSAEFTAGEIRGQLVPEPVRLSAILTGAQEVPARDTQAYGAAQAVYDPATNMISTLVFVYNFTNTLADSHIHEAPEGSNGTVRVPFGGAAAYQNSGSTYAQIFADKAYGGTPLLLLNEGAYVNIHSNVFQPGEIRGQLRATRAETRSRLINVSARGMVGTGDGALITGFVVEGTEPLAVLATGRGPVLAQLGVSGVLADPAISVRDAAGRLLQANDNFDDALLPDQIWESGFAPLEVEAAAFLLLPPGAYTSVMGGVGGTTGIGLVEAYEVSW